MNGEEAEKLRRQLAEAQRERNASAVMAITLQQMLDEARHERDALRAEAAHHKSAYDNECGKAHSYQQEVEALRKELAACQESRDGYANAYHDYAAKIAVAEQVAYIKTVSGERVPAAQVLNDFLKAQGERLASAEEALRDIRDQRCDERTHENCCEWDRDVAAAYFAAKESTEARSETRSDTNAGHLDGPATAVEGPDGVHAKGNTAASVLTSLSAEELAKAPELTDEQIRDALTKGQREADEAALLMRGASVAPPQRGEVCERCDDARVIAASSFGAGYATCPDCTEAKP
jgi:hypothetical protein